MLIYVSLEGCSYDLRARDLRLDRSDSDQRIKDAIERHLRLAADRLDPYVIDRPPGGNLIVRPAAER
ncbi:MAG TPA: hypothetical protein PK847_00700 [Candidatus Sumerlaeota bacterium]|nr:MAG: hypothetical protein BWZ08_00415 [candidate division BRC1 bacterium ADurb.BinA292]HOE95078.1 hypothetical protein [Candidatus Sumerlaeota bacterium]HOR26423.1 hypothetical protein [Candidatus Sumerlaeota bacterium]